MSSYADRINDVAESLSDAVTLANETTGADDDSVTDAINTLIAGYGSASSDWELIDEITTTEELTSLRMTNDYSQFKEIIVMAMVQPHSTLTANYMIKAGFADTSNCSPWSEFTSALCMSSKSTEHTVFGLVRFYVNNLGIYAETYRSCNNSSVSSMLALYGTGYSESIMSPYYNEAKLASAADHTNFDIIAQSPYTEFTNHLDIGSYINCIGTGSIFRVYGRG